MQRIVYTSREVEHFTLEKLTSMLKKIRPINQAAELTGVLFYYQGLFLQVLEGSALAIDSTMARILADARHTDIAVLARCTSKDGMRIFPDWRMGFFHMTAIESLFEGGLVSNDLDEMQRLLSEAECADPVAQMLRAFWRENRSLFQSPVLPPHIRGVRS